MRLAAAALAALFLVIYLPDLGHGFIQDDFRWIVEGRIERPADAVSLFAENVGFYRPLVSLTFAADAALWGTEAGGYGVTNLLLCVAAAAALFALARRLGLPRPAALVGTAAWMLNFHAVNMAVLWLSGRTALLATLFSLLTALASLAGRPTAAGLLALLAMLAKEEAVALPALLTLEAFLNGRDRPIGRTRPAWAALAGYMALRLRSGAFWPADAPSYYQFTFSPASVLRNLLEYADRAGTVFVAVAIVLIAVSGVRWRDVSPDERRALRFAGLWIAATYALTVWLPVRSSLYALLPSAGTAVALGMVASAAMRRRPERLRVAAIGLLVMAMALTPVYRARNERWVRIAELSERTLDAIAEDAGGLAGGYVVLVDDPAERFNFASAFGGLFPEALRFRFGSEWTGEIAAEPTAAADLVYRLRGTELIRVRP